MFAQQCRIVITITFLSCTTERWDPQYTLAEPMKRCRVVSPPFLFSPSRLTTPLLSCV